MGNSIYIKVRNKDRELEMNFENVGSMGEADRIRILSGVFDLLEVRDDLARMVDDYKLLDRYMNSIELDVDETRNYPEQYSERIRLERPKTFPLGDEMEEDYASISGPDNEDWRDSGIKIFGDQEYKRCRYLCECGKEGNRYIKDKGDVTKKRVECHDCGKELGVRRVKGGERDAWGNWFLAGKKQTD